MQSFTSGAVWAAFSELAAFFQIASVWQDLLPIGMQHHVTIMHA